MSTFQLCGLDPEPFAPLFALSDDALHARGARRIRADSPTAYPCRVSLEDAAAGDELLLLPYTHVEGPSPYQAAGPIFVRRGARRCVLPPGALPPYITRRLISIRSYDAAGTMLDADVCSGEMAASWIDSFFAQEAVDVIHLHNARGGCFACRVQRA